MLETERVGERSYVVGPIEQRPVGQRVGEADTGPVDRDPTHVVARQPSHVDSVAVLELGKPRNSSTGRPRGSPHSV